jgi:hypothetical protein
VSRFLDRWPLTLVGLILIGWSVAHLSDEALTENARFVVLGLGVFVLGAGTCLVILGVGRGRGNHDGDKED